MQIKTHFLDFNSKSVTPDPLNIFETKRILDRKTRLIMDQINEIKYPKRLYNAFSEKINQKENLKQKIQWIENDSIQNERKFATLKEAEIKNHYQNIEAKKIFLDPHQDKKKKKRYQSAGISISSTYYNIFIKPKFKELENKNNLETNLVSAVPSNDEKTSKYTGKSDDNPLFLLCAPNKIPRIISAFTVQSDDKVRIQSAIENERVSKNVNALRIFSALPEKSEIPIKRVSKTGVPLYNSKISKPKASISIKSLAFPREIKSAYFKKTLPTQLVSSLGPVSSQFTKIKDTNFKVCEKIYQKLPFFNQPCSIAPNEILKQDLFETEFDLNFMQMIFDESSQNFDVIKEKIMDSEKSPLNNNVSVAYRFLFFAFRYEQKGFVEKAVSYYTRFLKAEETFANKTAQFFVVNRLCLCFFLLSDFNTAYQYAENLLARSSNFKQFRFVSLIGSLVCSRAMLNRSVEKFYLESIEQEIVDEGEEKTCIFLVHAFIHFLNYKEIGLAREILFV